MRTFLVCLSLIFAIAIAQPNSWWTTSFARSEISTRYPSVQYGQTQTVGGVGRTYLPASTMLGANAFPGNPCAKTNDCQAHSNTKLLRYVETRAVEPLGRVTGLKPALDSLQVIMNNVKNGNITLYNLLGTAGMTCCRLIRGSTTSFSNHAWGAAIDIKINGQIDTFADDRVINGLCVLAPYFQAQGWFWGAGFSREDGMHFEVSQQTMQQWISSGAFGGGASPTPTPAPAKYNLCSKSNYFPQIQSGSTNTDANRFLQNLLNYWSVQSGSRWSIITVDGSFGPTTSSTVKAFQTYQGLASDGVVGSNSWAKLWSFEISQGATGWHIQAIIQLMNSLGYSLLSGASGASTTYGSALYSAIQDFQEDRFFAKNGRITNALVEAMLSDPSCVDGAAYEGADPTADIPCDSPAYTLSVDSSEPVGDDPTPPPEVVTPPKCDDAVSLGFSAVVVVVLALLALMM